MGTIDPHSVTDEDIVRFLDDEMALEDRASFEEVIAASPELGDRVLAMTLDVPSLRADWDDALSEAPALELPEPVVPPVPHRSWAGWQMAAAAVMLFAVGLGLGLGYEPTAPEGDWHQAVADYQVLYTTETVTATPLSPEQRANGLALVSERVGVALSSEGIELDGLAFQRAQVLEFDGQPLAQLVYLDGDGLPIAFCIMRRTESDTGVADREIAGLNASSWQDGAHGYIVIGAATPAKIRAAADTLRSRMPG